MVFAPKAKGARTQPRVSYLFSALLNRPGRPWYPIIRYPTGRFFRGTLSQALRARLRSVSSLRDALADIWQQHLAKACCELSRRDGAIVARRFIAGLAVHRDLRPGGTLEVGSGPPGDTDRRIPRLFSCIGGRVCGVHAPAYELTSSSLISCSLQMRLKSSLAESVTMISTSRG